MTTTGEFAEFKIDQELVDGIRDITVRRKKVEELIDNVEKSRDKVRPEIFEKVSADYGKRLAEVTEEYNPMSVKICERLSAIANKERELKAEIDKVNVEIEEQEFRCSMGEFSQAELTPIKEEKAATLETFNKQIEVIEGTFKECQELLTADDYEAALKGEPKPPPAPIAEATQPELNKEAKEKKAPAKEEPVKKEEAPKKKEAAKKREAPKKETPKKEAPKKEAPKKEAQVEEEPPPPPQVNKPAAVDEKRATEIMEEELGDEDVAEESVPFIRLLKKGGEAEDFPIVGPKLQIGRSSRNEIIIKGQGISRQHAYIELVDGKYSIFDTSSVGGVIVNGEKVKEAALKGGDMITIAIYVMEFCQE